MRQAEVRAKESDFLLPLTRISQKREARREEEISVRKDHPWGGGDRGCGRGFQNNSGLREQLK